MKCYEMLLTEEEYIACVEIIEERREKERRQALIQKCKMAISSEIASTISTIGLAETKTIVRALNRELRELGEFA